VPLTNLSQLKQFLDTLGIKPKKSLSQNFLVDGNIVQKIIKEAAIEIHQPVLEIGPGPGALTEALISAGANVYAVEKDPLYAQALARFPTVQTFNQDIREFDFEILPLHSKVVANLPYHLTAPILGLLAPRNDLFSTLTLMVQEEVARRMTANPGSKEFGPLTVFIFFYTTPRYAFKVSRHCFYPQPKVDSAIVHLQLKKPPLEATDAFFAFVRKAFQQRRKMLKSSLGAEVGVLLEALNLNPQARPEDLSVDQFVALFMLNLTHQKGDSSIDL
jgi:16S rRNA (adenine1518-N6/adenine1519-N6)-dimethyltransferase